MRQATTAPDTPCEVLLDRVTTCLRELGPSPEANIQMITELCGELLGAVCAMYKRVDGPLLCVQAEWQVPPDMPRDGHTHGRIGFDVVQQNRGTPLLVRDLPATSYARTDPNVLKYDLQTYMGLGIGNGGEAIGSLCVVFQHDFVPTPLQTTAMVLLGAAIGMQEVYAEQKRTALSAGQRAAQLIDALPAGIFLVDDETHRIVDANPAALAMIGAPKEAVIDKLCHQFVCPAEVGECPISDLGHTVDHSERLLLRADGSSLDVLKSIGNMDCDGRKLLVECVMEHADVERDVAENAAVAEPGHTPGAELHVLLVSPVERELTAQWADELRAAGCTMKRATNASSALERMHGAVARGAPFPAVIVDAALSGIDARLFAELVRDDEPVASTALLLLLNEDSDGETLPGYAAALHRSADAASIVNDVCTAAAIGVHGGNGDPRGDDETGSRILLVEDNTINMEVAREMLEHLGVASDPATDGQEAIEAARKRSYDLILMDCQMPGVDGYEATRQIRAWEEASRVPHQTPIVAVTAHAMKGDRERCFRCGMNDYMTKPVEAERLATLIAKWMPVTQGKPPAKATGRKETASCL